MNKGWRNGESFFWREAKNQS